LYIQKDLLRLILGREGSPTSPTGTPAPASAAYFETSTTPNLTSSACSHMASYTRLSLGMVPAIPGNDGLACRKIKQPPGAADASFKQAAEIAHLSGDF